MIRRSMPAASAEHDRRWKGKRGRQVSEAARSAVSVGSGSIDCSNVEDLPQFKHSAAVLPSAPFSNRYSLPPQCGHMNNVNDVGRTVSPSAWLRRPFAAASSRMRPGRRLLRLGQKAQHGAEHYGRCTLVYPW
jgi:hypothetical protein